MIAPSEVELVAHHGATSGPHGPLVTYVHRVCQLRYVASESRRAAYSRAPNGPADENPLVLAFWRPAGALKGTAPGGLCGVFLSQKRGGRKESPLASAPVPRLDRHWRPETGALLLPTPPSLPLCSSAGTRGEGDRVTARFSMVVSVGVEPYAQPCFRLRPRPHPCR